MRQAKLKFCRHLVRVAVVLISTAFCHPTLAGAPSRSNPDFIAGFLGETAVVATERSFDLRIQFLSGVRYLRHFPETSGDTLRISLEVSNPCVAEAILLQETRVMPRQVGMPEARVTFPERLRDPANGSVCQATGNRANQIKTLVIKFDRATEFSVQPGTDNNLIVVSLPRPAAAQPPKQEAAPAAVVSPNGDSVQPKPADGAVQQEQSPESLLMAARTALKADDPAQAVTLLNRLLALPANDYTPEAQELIGWAREKMGEVEKARSEYEHYLKLFPNGEGAERVKLRLASLASVPAAPAQPLNPKPKKGVKEIHQNTVVGGVSQYYYTGWTQTRADNYGADEVTKTRTKDLSSLISNFDTTARFRHNQYDTKIVFRDTQTHNFPGDVSDKNALTAAFVEHQNKEHEYMFRLGRQSGTSQGVMGRFDGVFGRYAIDSAWRVTAVAGVPDNGSQSTIETNRHFYGASVEFGPLSEKWSGDIYGIQQIADGLVERRALGGEVRYFNGPTNWYGMVDYDVIYDTANIIMLQGNWISFTDYNFNLLLDRRKSPMLYGEIAIQGVTGATSVGDLRNTLSDSQIYDYVKNLAADSDTAMLSVTRQVTPRWQLGGDVRYNRTSGIDGAGDSSAQPGTGDIFTYTLQATGTGVLLEGDTSTVMFSHVDDPNYYSRNLSLSNSLTLRDNWRLDSSLRFYYEHTNDNIKTRKWMPGLRVNYRWSDSMSFEAEATVERSHTDDPVSTTTTDTWRENLYVGYRWDFR